MDPVTQLRHLEVKTFLSVVTRLESETALDARTFHLLGTYRDEDFDQLSSVVLDRGGTASFAFLGRDIDEQHDIIASLDREGHEIVLHGHRHVGCGDIDYDIAHENLTRGLEAIESATGITPPGFFAPQQRMSDGTIRAADELGFDWVFGRYTGALPDSLDLVEPVNPYDVLLLNDGHSPAETFDQLADPPGAGRGHLVHPNLLEYFDATAVFYEWLSNIEPVSVGTSLAGSGAGVVMDCIRPLRIE